MKAITLTLLLAVRLVSADATVTVQGGESWKNAGWHSEIPILDIGQVHVVARGKATAKVPAAKRLQRMKITMGGGQVADAFTFLVDVRDGHRYSIYPDPCCFLTVSDRDDGLVEHATCGKADSCPAGTVEVDKFAYRKDECGKQPTCAPPALVRGVFDQPVMTISFDDSDEAPLTRVYQIAPVGREAPVHVVVRIKGRIVIDERVIFHHGAHYTVVGSGVITIDD